MNPPKPNPKYRQIGQVLAQRIQAGRYNDDGLPGERELALEFGVARVTVRNALKSLSDAGLVIRKERRGTLASSANGAPSPRRLLRELVDQFLDRGRVDQRRVLAFGFTKASENVAGSLGLEPGARVLRVVRARSQGPQPLMYTEAFVPEGIGLQITRRELERRPFVQVLESLGIEVGDAEQIVAADAVPASIAPLLGLASRAPVLKLHRVLYDSTGVAVQLLLGWYRADQFDFAMRMSRKEDSMRVWVRDR